mgnify:CR=1 FL=1
MRLGNIIAACACLATVGCATPQSILNQGVQGTKLSSALETELAKFSAAETQAAELKKQSILAQRETRVEARRAVDGSNLVSAFVGDSQAQEIQQRLEKLYQGVQTIDASYADALLNNKKTIDDLLKPLPATEAPLNELSKSFAEMGTELSDDARFDEAKAIIKTIQDGLKKNATAATAAQAEASKAQPTTAGTP